MARKATKTSKAIVTKTQGPFKPSRHKGFKEAKVSDAPIRAPTRRK